MKAKKIITFLLASIFTFAFVGCNNAGNSSSENKESNNTGAAETNPLLVNPVVCLNEFETQKDFNLLALENLLGKVEINTDTTYVKSGNGSAKVTVVHDPYDYRNAPMMYQALSVDRLGVDCTDVNKVSDVTFSVYNTSTETKKIALQLYYLSGKTASTWFELAPNGWTDIRYTLPRESIAVSTDEGGKEIRYVAGIYMTFERPSDTDDVFYFDNMYLYPTQKQVETAIRTLKEDEIASFDSWWQITELGYEGGLYVPTAEWSKEMTVDEDGAALKLIAPPGGSWPAICLTASYCSLIDWKSYSGSDTLSMSFYLPKNQELEVAVTLYSGAKVIMVEQKKLTPGEWNHWTWTVDEINSISQTKYAGYTFAGLTKMTIGYRGFSGSASKTLYVDNVRMIKANTSK